jgi:cyclase
MIKSRLIPIIVLKGNLIVQSLGFQRYLPIGKVKMAIEFFVNWDVDEIVLIDIDATKEKRKLHRDIVEEACSKCFIPLSVGGGIKTLKDIRETLRSGADKVLINEAAYRNPQFISEAASSFGSSTITVSVDARKIGKNYYCYYRNGTINSNKLVEDWIKEIEDLGAGEILINSIDRDGYRKGYDLDLLNLVSRNVSIPVIACGGVGNVTHFVDGLTKGNCQAVAAANIFQHTEHSTIAAKAFMKKKGINVRLSSEVKYKNFGEDSIGRPV